MAIRATVQTEFGEDRELYIRINHVEVTNRGDASNAVFFGYISAEASEAGSARVWFLPVSAKVDVSKALWPQFYAAIKRIDGFKTAVDC